MTLPRTVMRAELGGPASRKKSNAAGAAFWSEEPGETPRDGHVQGQSNCPRRDLGDSAAALSGSPNDNREYAVFASRSFRGVTLFPRV